MQKASENQENVSTHEPEPVADAVIQRSKSELIVSVYLLPGHFLSSFVCDFLYFLDKGQGNPVKKMKRSGSSVSHSAL